MNKSTASPHSISKVFLVGVALACLCALNQHSSSFFSKLVSEDVVFRKVGPTKWIADASGLKNGTYYISLGRPRGICDLTADGTKLNSNGVIDLAVQDSLLMGATIAVTESHKISQLGVNCLVTDGFLVAFTHQPVVATQKAGIFLQCWRAFTDLFLGPLASIILLGSLVLQIRRRTQKFEGKHNDEMTSWPHLVFAVVAFLYSCSLAHYPRFFLSPLISTSIHIVLRNAFSLAIAFLFASYSRHRPWTYATHALLALGTIAITLVNPQYIVPFYDWQYWLFAAVSAAMTYELFKVEARTESIFALRCIGVAWTLIQMQDTVALWIRFGAYSAPSILALLATVVGYIKYRETLRRERIHLATHRLLSVIEAKSPIREVLAQIATITSGETHFARVSAYIDAFCVGHTDQPCKKFIRVMENGYKKDTKQDYMIDFNDGRGTYITEAIETQQMVLRKSERDDAWFIVVPIGRHAVLNLSDVQDVSPYSVYESEEILKRLHPALGALNSRLVEHGLRQGFALDKLRSIRGDGRFDCEIGSVFADINDYSYNSERYGSSFGEFVSATYFPALIKAVSKWSAPEFVRGDELYLVTIAELLPKDTSVAKATLNCIAEIQSFISNEGAQLCSQGGFAPITMSIGGNVGITTLICDSIKVRTAGQNVNEAKRLQEAAAKGEALVKATTVAAVEKFGSFGEEKPVLIKKNFIIARRFLGLRDVEAA